MRQQQLPSPPEDSHKAHGISKTKNVKRVHRGTKRAGSNASLKHHDLAAVTNSSIDGRHKRVWKACERCRMKKTKCTGEFPCKRCKDDHLICTARFRKKIKYKQLPRGYAEVLENTQFSLVATILKLYSMVRSNKRWDLDEPDVNDQGQPVIHSIANILGCIRRNSDIDLPVHSVFPEDQSGLDQLARQLEQHHQRQSNQEGDQSWHHPGHTHSDSTASSPELEHSDYEHDHRRMAFVRENGGSSNSSYNSIQSFATSNEYDFAPGPGSLSAFADSTASLFPSPVPTYTQWHMKTEPQIIESDTMMPFLQQLQGMMPSQFGTDMLQQGFKESHFGTLKPHSLRHGTQGVMLGMGDPMLFRGNDEEAAFRI